MSHLFTPLRLREIEFKNRIFLSPMCQYSCEAGDGVPTAWHQVHLGSRAVGGAALVVTEAAAVSPEGRISPQDAGLYNDVQQTEFAKLAHLIESLGAVPGIQLAHAGRKAATFAPWKGRGAVPEGWDVLAPSAVPFADNFPMPRAMSLADINHVKMQFVQAAERALVAGFKVIELHFAHGYLIAQFLGEGVNTRHDDYGGVLANRARLALEVAEAVRRVWPVHLPLFARLSVTNWRDKNLDLDLAETIQVATWLKERGVDLIDCSSGGLYPNVDIPTGPGYQVPLAAAVRAGAQMPVAAVGMITQAVQAEQIIATEQADVVFLARALLQDPYWPLHAARVLRTDMAWPKPYERGRDT